MIWDEEAPNKRRRFELGADLSDFSVGELEDYLAQLGAERERVEAMLASKKTSRSKADSIFKN